MEQVDSDYWCKHEVPFLLCDTDKVCLYDACKKPVNPDKIRLLFATSCRCRSQGIHRSGHKGIFCCDCNRYVEEQDRKTEGEGFCNCALPTTTANGYDCCLCMKPIHANSPVFKVPYSTRRDECIFHVRRFLRDEYCFVCSEPLAETSVTKLVRAPFIPKDPCVCEKPRKNKELNQHCHTCKKHLTTAGHIQAIYHDRCNCVEPTVLHQRARHCGSCRLHLQKFCDCVAPIKENKDLLFFFDCHNHIDPTRDTTEAENSECICLQPTISKKGDSICCNCNDEMR